MARGYKVAIKEVLIPLGFRTGPYSLTYQKDIKNMALIVTYMPAEKRIDISGYKRGNRIMYKWIPVGTVSQVKQELHMLCSSLIMRIILEE